MFASYEVATSFQSLTAIKGYDLDKSTYVPLMGHIVGGWFWWFLVGGVHNGQSSKYSVLILFLGAPTCRADRTPTHGALDLALTDMFRIFSFSLNRAKKWFNAIFDSKLTPEYSYKMIFLKREIRKTFCWKLSDRLFIKKFRDHSCDCWFVIVNINLGSFSANLVSIPFIEKWIFCPKWTK